MAKRARESDRVGLRLSLWVAIAKWNRKQFPEKATKFTRQMSMVQHPMQQVNSRMLVPLLNWSIVEIQTRNLRLIASPEKVILNPSSTVEVLLFVIKINLLPALIYASHINCTRWFDGRDSSENFTKLNQETVETALNRSIKSEKWKFFFGELTIGSNESKELVLVVYWISFEMRRTWQKWKDLGRVWNVGDKILTLLRCKTPSKFLLPNDASTTKLGKY